MSFHPNHPLQAFWNLAAAPIQTLALELALKHHLFAISPQPFTAASVAQQLTLHDDSTVIWLDLLWSMGLLARHVPDSPDAQPQYSASSLATRFFLDASNENCAQSWQYRAGLLGRFATQLETLLKHGYDPGRNIANGATPQGSWAQAAREQIGQEQRTITVPAVLRQLDTLPPFPEQGRFLDLGGGPGHVGIALARRLPAWRGTICDQPETADVAQENIQQANLSDRLDILACDLNHDTIGNGYDLIWCSSVLHFLDDTQAAVRKMFEALSPGGLLILAHAELADDPALAARVLPFYATVMLRGNHLPSSGEIARTMTSAGFRDVQTLGRADFPMAPVWLHTGRRPRLQ